MGALGIDMKKVFEESLRLLPYRTDWMVPPLANTGSPEEGQEEIGSGHPCFEVLMGKCTGKETKEAKLGV